MVNQTYYNINQIIDKNATNINTGLKCEYFCPRHSKYTSALVNIYQKIDNISPWTKAAAFMVFLKKFSADLLLKLHIFDEGG